MIIITNLIDFVVVKWEIQFFVFPVYCLVEKVHGQKKTGITDLNHINERIFITLSLAEI